jgi:hypothetical protein
MGDVGGEAEVKFERCGSVGFAQAARVGCIEHERDVGLARHGECVGEVGA